VLSLRIPRLEKVQHRRECSKAVLSRPYIAFIGALQLDRAKAILGRRLEKVSIGSLVGETCVRSQRQERDILDFADVRGYQTVAIEFPFERVLQDRRQTRQTRPFQDLQLGGESWRDVVFRIYLGRMEVFDDAGAEIGEGGIDNGSCVLLPLWLVGDDEAARDAMGSETGSSDGEKEKPTECTSNDLGNSPEPCTPSSVSATSRPK
jgi:hypothetical protein